MDAVTQAAVTPPRTRATAQMAEFETPDALRHAVDRLWELGYREIEAYSPYQVPGVAERLHRSRGHIPLLTLLGGAGGALLGYAVQWYTNVWSYPLNIGGKPPSRGPAFVPATFESAVLCAALAAFVVLFLGLRLPRLWHPEHAVPGFERVSVDRFWVRIDGRDHRAADVDFTARELAALSPLRIVRVESDA